MICRLTTFSTHAITDVGCNVWNARELSRAVKVEIFRRLTKYKCIQQEPYLVNFPIFQFQQGTMVDVDYNTRWNFGAN
jgi:hypothetical protein